MTMKEYTFQAILSYEAESEEDAWISLALDLKHNMASMFDCIQELPIIPDRKKDSR